MNKKGVISLEKIAILNLNSDSIKMQFINVNKNKSFSPYKSIEMPINLTKDFYGDNLIKTAVSKEIMSIVKIYRKMADKENIKEALCFASPIFREAKNNNGVLNEISNATGFEFKIIGEEDEINYTYTAIINTFNKPKGLIVSFNSFSTFFIIVEIYLKQNMFLLDMKICIINILIQQNQANNSVKILRKNFWHL